MKNLKKKKLIRKNKMITIENSKVADVIDSQFTRLKKKLKVKK